MTQPEQPIYRVLGPVAVLDAHGEPLALGGAQRRAVLAQLILAEGHTVSVDALSIGLWDEPPASAVKSIQVHVSKLRPVLREAAGADVLVTRPPGYALAAPAGATDVECFRRLVDEGRHAMEAGDPLRAAEHLRSALGLWRGTALADVARFPFAHAATARLEEARLQALDARVAADLAVGRHELLVPELEGLVRDHPLRERSWAQLILALYRSDRQADALDAYARARHVLVDELGLEPGPELRQLEHAVLTHTVAPVAPQAARSTRCAPPDLRPPPIVVGRDQSLADLRAELDAVRAGTATVVAISGDEGLGKTSLIAAFASSIGDTTVVAGRCREHLAVPFGPWSDILRQLRADDLVELLVGAVDPDDDAPEHRRALLFGGVVQRLREAATTQPVIVVLDDMHWSDDATLTLLLHALDELHDRPVLFLLAWRGHEVGVGHPVTRLEHVMARRNLRRVELAPLRTQDVADLLTALSPDPEPGHALDDQAHVETMAERIHDVTGGVPLFVAEAVATLPARNGDLPDPDDLAPELPEVLQTLVVRRLTMAGTGAAAVAEACAVLTDPFTVAVVQHLLPDLDAFDVVRALDALVEVGLLDEGVVGYTFQHAAFRRAISAAMRAGRRQTLHAGAYRALEHEPIPPAVLVLHSESAGPLVAPDVVVRQLRRAGTDAGQRGAFVDAAAFLSRAADSTAPAERAPVLVALADALWRAGDIAAAKAVADEVIHQSAEGTVAPDVLTDAVVLHGTFGAGYGLDPASIAAVDTALTHVEDPALRCRLYAARAYHHAMWGSPVAVALDAAAAARAGLPAARPPDPSLLAEVAFAESLALIGTAELDRRLDLAAELCAIGRRTGARREVGRGLRMRSLALMSAGRTDEVQRTLDELIVIAEQTGSWLYRSDAWRWRIALAMAAGDVAQAAADLDELERVSAGVLAGRAFVGTQRLLLHWAQDELEPCIELLDLLREVLPAHADRAGDRRLVDLFRLMVLVEMGRTAQAHDELLELRPDLDIDLAAARRYPAELALTALLVARFGMVDLAADLARRLEPFRGQVLVLSWGEGLLGAADRFLGELTSLVDGTIDGASFAAAEALERAAGLEVEVRRTDRARRRVQQDLGVAT